MSVTASCTFFNSREVTVNRATSFGERDYFREELICGDKLSFESANFLRGNLLQDDFKKDPDKTLYKLNELYRISQDIKYLQIAADLTNYLALHSKEEEALGFHLTCLKYCIRVINIQREKKEVYPFPLYYFTIPKMAQIYNNACCGIFKYLKKKNILEADSISLQGREGISYILKKPVFQLSVPKQVVSDFSLCSSYKVHNLMQISRKTGIGVSLVGKVSVEKQPFQSLRFPQGMTIPVTLCIQMTENPNKKKIDLHLIFQDTFLRESIVLHDKNEEWPLSLDFSTPLACYLNDLMPRNVLSVMLDPLKNESSSGLYLLEPYQTNKIPVLFIHGLMSSPETWGQMINSLRNNPIIRKRYQFWFYYYSSGSPVIISAKDLYRTLQTAQREICITPEATANFNKMVIAGHSMGGMITRLLLLKNPYSLLETITQLSKDEIYKKLKPQDIKLLEDLMVFHPLPFVHRAIFMAVPHKGADMAQSPIAHLGEKIIRLPHSLLEKKPELTRIRKILDPAGRTIPQSNMRNVFYTGIDNLDPDNSFIKMLQGSPMKTDLIYHCIIGNLRKAGTPGGSDGVVPYSSSHLNNATSELIVKSNHSVHRKPAAIREVMRILLLHLKENHSLQ